jgi:hypothetical protein
MLPQNSILPVENVKEASLFLLALLYSSEPLPKHPLSDNPTLIDRNQTIRLRYLNGQSVPSLANEYGVSEQRIYQIINKKRK